MVRSRSMLALPAVLIALAIAAAPVSASGCLQIREGLLAPWTQGAPPGAQRGLLEQAEVVIVVDDPPEEGTYWFAADLAAGQCELDTCVRFPDLAVAWYAADDSLLMVNEEEDLYLEGSVPREADYGLVFFRTLPYVFSYPLAVPLYVNGHVCP